MEKVVFKYKSCSAVLSNISTYYRGKNLVNVFIVYKDKWEVWSKFCWLFGNGNYIWLKLKNAR
jgi:hypothetical protein